MGDPDAAPRGDHRHGIDGPRHLRDMLRATTRSSSPCASRRPTRSSSTATEFTARRPARHRRTNPTGTRFVERFAPTLDVVFIVTPHAFHAAQAIVGLEAGLDVLLEKPMVMDAAEAEALIATRDRTGRLLVVAVPGQPLPAGP